MNSKFKTGDEVTIKEDRRFGFMGDLDSPHRLPKFGEVHVVSITHFQWGHWCMGLIGFPATQGFIQDDFEKIVSDRVLRDQLESVPEPFTL